MHRRYLLLSILLCLPVMASEPSMIVCEPLIKNDHSATGIWPSPYLSQDKLCFDMRVDSGDSCVSDGQTASWLSAGVIVDIDGIPQGRDDTWFRVVKPTITDKKIEYVIEGSRDKKTWGKVSNVSINRLSGKAVDWFIGEHGGDSYQCHLEGRKI